MNVLSAIAYARACVYQEAYVAETKSGGNSKVVAACLVGIFDAPLIMVMLLILDSLLFNGLVIRNTFSSNLTSVFSVLFFILVSTFEYFYYIVLKIGLKGVRPTNKVVGISYAVISLVGGGILIYFLW